MALQVASNEYYGIKILKDGTWLYGGTPITRHNLVKLFATVLKKDADGGYWLETPYEKGRIEVEDAPFVAVGLETSKTGILSFRTNLDDEVEAGPDHPIRVAIDPVTETPSPYILIRDNLEARIARSVYYTLADLAVESGTEKGLYGVTSHGIFYPIGKIRT